MGSLLRHTVAFVAVLAACLMFTFGAAAFGLRRSPLQRIDTVTASQLAADYSEDPHGASQPPLSPAIVAAAANDDRSLRAPAVSPTVRADVTRTPTPPLELTQRPMGTATPRPTVTATSEPTETHTPEPSPTEIPTQEPTATPVVDNETPTEVPTEIPTETETPTETPTPTPTKIVCPSAISGLPPIRGLCETPTPTPTPTPKPVHIAPTN